jgi:hypothetical protein
MKQDSRSPKASSKVWHCAALHLRGLSFPLFSLSVRGLNQNPDGAAPDFSGKELYFTAPV